MTTALFKRLESSGHAFVLSLERHVRRNFVYIHAIENGLPLPIGTQDMALLDARDKDAEILAGDDDSDTADESLAQMQAAEIYAVYASKYASRFDWLKPEFFRDELVTDLREDAASLMKILHSAGEWNAARDTKLEALVNLLTQTHPREKVLVFSQFADTVDYIAAELAARGVASVAGVTGDTKNPTEVAHRFSPISNEKRQQIATEQELRVVVATDVLSEGQNLQDCSIIVNHDLPWAIIRLIQRAGRVDRIGQQAEIIRCYSFLPADGVEKIIRLRARVQQRLQENADTIGADETFFEGDEVAVDANIIKDLFTEKAGILDDADDAEVDLASQAYQIWKNAIDRDPRLEKIVTELPNNVYSARPHDSTTERPEGTLVYIRTAEGNDSLAWIDHEGRSVTESQFEILKAAECEPNTPALPPHARHHELVNAGIELIAETEMSPGGQLGNSTSPRRQTYDRLKDYAASVKDTFFKSSELKKVIDELFAYPLLQSARDSLQWRLKNRISDAALAEFVIALHIDGRLCQISEDAASNEPQLICSLGLRK